MTATAVKTEESKDAQIARMLQAKARIMEAIRPATQYMNFVLDHFPEHDNERDKGTIRMMWSFRTIDAEILGKLEQLPELLKNS